MMRDMNLARYAQLAMLLMAVVISAVNPSLAQTVLVLGALTGMLAGSAMTSGTLTGTIAGIVVGSAVSLYLIGTL